MRAILQRVASASVRVAGETVGAIGQGLLVLLGVEKGDGPAEVEATAKKATFQQVAAATLELKNFLPRRGDVHRFAREAEHREAYGIVLARAFADLEVLLELAGAFLRPGGELWAMKGRKLPQEQAAVSGRILAPFEPQPAMHPYDFPEAGTGGVIAVYRRRGSPLAEPSAKGA